MSRPSDRPFAGATLHGEARARAVAVIEAHVAAKAADLVAKAVDMVDADRLSHATTSSAVAILLAHYCQAREARIAASVSTSRAEEAMRDTMIDTLQHIRVCRLQDFIRAAFKA